MGFRTGAFCKVWEVTPVSDTNVKVRISTSKKNKQTNEYEQDFSGFANIVGSVPAKNAASLKAGDRIKLGDVDVTTRYVAEKKTTYTNYRIFSFETIDGPNAGSAHHEDHTDPQPTVDSGEVDDSRLPF